MYGTCHDGVYPSPNHSDGHQSTLSLPHHPLTCPLLSFCAALELTDVGGPVFEPIVPVATAATVVVIAVLDDAQLVVVVKSVDDVVLVALDVEEQDDPVGLPNETARLYKAERFSGVCVPGPSGAGSGPLLPPLWNCSLM